MILTEEGPVLVAEDGTLLLVEVPTPGPQRVLSRRSSGDFDTSGASKSSASTMDVVAGDLIVLIASAESGAITFGGSPSTSGGSIAWTTLQSYSNGTNDTAMKAWSGVVGATATGVTLTLATSADTSRVWGFVASLWRGHGGVGASAVVNLASAAAQVSLTTSASSAAEVQANDWNAADGTSRSWLSVNGSVITEDFYYRNAAHHAVYEGFHLDLGAAGADVLGLSAPTGMHPTVCAVEIRKA